MPVDSNTLDSEVPDVQARIFGSALRAGHGIVALADRYRYLLLILFSFIYFAATIYRASRKLFWFDEIFTVYMSNLPGLPSMWRALVGGADGELPLLYGLTIISKNIFGAGPIGIRMPEIISFWIFCLCLYRFVSLRSNAFAGFISMFFPLITAAYWYSYEARAHGLALSGAGVALVCWQAAAGRERDRLWPLAGLSLTLGASLLLHAYAVLVFVPLAAGELCRLIVGRRADWPLWLAVSIAAPVALIAVPLLAASKGFVNPFPASPNSLMTSYPILFHSSVSVLVCALILICISNLPISSGPPKPPAQPLEGTPREGMPLHEIVALIVSAASPIVVFVIARITGSPMLPRYALIAVFGVSALLGLSLARKPLIGVLIVFLIGIQFWWSLGRYRVEVDMPEPMRYPPLSISRADYDTRYALFNSVPDRTLPIVLLDAIDFAPTIYYAPPEILPRLIYLYPTDEDMTGFLYRHLIIYAHAPGRVSIIDNFVNANPKFLAFGVTGYCGEIERFKNDGASVQVISSTARHWLFLVNYGTRKVNP